MTSNTVKLSSNTSMLAPTNDNTLTKLLALDATNNIKYRNVSSITSGSANQSLNTTNSVAFNKVTTGSLHGSGTNNALNVMIPNDTYYLVTFTTNNNTFQTIFTLATVTNTDYLIFVEISAMDTTSLGGASYLQTKRVTNNNGSMDIGQLESVSSKTTGNIASTNAQVIISGTSTIVQVQGVNTDTVSWTGFIRVVSVA